MTSATIATASALCTCWILVANAQDKELSPNEACYQRAYSIELWRAVIEGDAEPEPALRGKVDVDRLRAACLTHDGRSDAAPGNAAAVNEPTGAAARNVQAGISPGLS